ncbi:MAG: GSCFA domain-containing protein [Planctomycetota bacterium]
MNTQMIGEHSMAVTLRKLRLKMWTESWKRLGLAAGGRPIALYGAGQHTRRFLAAVGAIEGGPTVSFVIDDNPGAPEITGIPVVTPGEADPGSVGLIVASSDSIEAVLVERAEAWSGGRVPVESLYGDDVDPSLLTFGDRMGALVTKDELGRTTVVDDSGRTTERETAWADADATRAPGAIPPLGPGWVWAYSEPGFSVSTNPIASEVSARFREHQVYPGNRAVGQEDLRDERLVTAPEPGLVTRDTRVSVIGSCFAVNFKHWLIEHGYNFCQFEDGPFASMGSLRTGPLFNPGSICQLAEWAFNGFDAADTSWTIAGRLCDPYRKSLSWPTEADMRAERMSHFAATRNMVEQSEVLIVTLGLSEVWRNREDKRCYYLSPPPGILDERYHEHALLTVDECVEQLESFYAIVREHNPSLRLVVTLSPVPLLATYFDRSAVVSDAVSKATLRAALHWFCERHPEVIYFPSYEMAVRTPEWPYAEDNRHVHPGPVVSRIMRAFVEAYGEAGDAEQIFGDAEPSGESRGAGPRRVYAA